MGADEFEMIGIIKWNNDMGSIRFWPTEIKMRTCEQRVSDSDSANSSAPA